MRNYDHYRTLIHPLIALVVPAAFLVSVVMLSAELFNFIFRMPAGFMTRLYPSLIFLSLLAGLSAVVLGNIFQTERASWTARARELMVLLLVVYLLASLLRGGSVPLRFVPSLLNSLPVLYAAVQWLSSVRIQNALRDREILAQELEGKEGDALYSGMRDAGLQPEAALEALQRLRGISTFFAVTLLVLLVPVGNIVEHISIPAITSIIAFYLVYFLILALCSQYSFEQYAAGAGLREDSGQRIARIRFAGLAILFVGGVGFLVGGYSVTIPTAWIESLATQLFRLLILLIARFLLLFKNNPQPDFQSEEGVQELIPYAENGIDWGAVFEIIGRLVPFGLAILLGLFLFAPLLSKKYRILLARHSIKDYFHELLMILRKWLGKKSGAEKDAITSDPDHLSEVRKRLRSLGAAHKNRIRRREFGRVSRSFLRLIQWGRRQGIVFTATSAPGSFTSELAKRFPAHESTLKDIADCFEQAVYSPYPLGKNRLQEYEQAVRMIIHAVPRT